MENLIASIKSKQLQETQRQSDRKILDIIHRVLGRTIDLVYDEDEQEKIQQELEEQRLREEEESRISKALVNEDEDLSTGISLAPAADRIDTEMEQEQAHPDAEDREQKDDDDEDIDERDRTIGTGESGEEEDEIDISRDPLYRHMLLGVTNEDVLNVRGSQINVPASLVRKNQRRPAKPAENTDKNVHHFCIQMADEADVLPKEIRAITQLYHQRARFRHQLPFTTNYHKHGQLPTFPPKETMDDGQQQEEAPRP